MEEEITQAPAEEAAAQEEQTPAPEAEDPAAAFERLIRGEYKEQFDRRVRGIVARRLKNAQESIRRCGEVEPLLQALSQRYGLGTEDIRGLTEAVSQDPEAAAREAAEQGVPVEMLQRMKKVERDNADLRQEMEQARQQDAQQRLFRRWDAEAAAARQIYPDLDMAREMEDERFVRLIANNIDVRTAYEVLHRDRLLPEAMRFGAREAEKRLASSLAANGRRPAEGGSAAGAGALRREVSRLTRRDMADIERRVRSGERISFS